MVSKNARSLSCKSAGTAIRTRLFAEQGLCKGACQLDLAHPLPPVHEQRVRQPRTRLRKLDKLDGLPI